MKQIMFWSYLVILLTPPVDALAFSFFKNCTAYNESPDSGIYHEIINADILKIGNHKQYSFALVECLGVPRRYAFSSYNDGVPLFPNSAVVLPQDKKELCEGDTLTVYGRECKIISMTAQKE